MINQPVIHLDRLGSGGSGGTAYIGVFTNYTDLITQYPTAPILSLAYVQNSQGTPWLPGSLLGTFYSKGTYLFDGVNWVDGLDEVSEELDNLVKSIFYNNDGILSSNRMVNGNSKNLTFNNLLTTQFNSETFSVLATAGATIQSSGIANATVETTGTGDVVLSTNTGNVKIHSLNYPKFDGANGQVLKTNGTGTLSFGTITEGLKTKSGKVLNVTFTGNPKIATVTFATPFVDANYSVVITVEGTKSYSPRINNGRTAGSFIINMSANNITGLTSILWTATKHGEN
jgi:hypothetical protein